MKILAISDEIAKEYYDYYQPGMLDDIDLIISCGDLPREYLEFLVTMGKAPLLYVHGNHDASYLEHPPRGCICIEDRIFEYGGLRFLGLGGSYRYLPDGKFMYTESEMRRRIMKVWYGIRRRKGFDVLVSHAPAYGCGDLDSPTHRGFHCFHYLLDRYKPAYMIHGHVHKTYNYQLPVRSKYKDTTIVNAFGKQLLTV